MRSGYVVLISHALSESTASLYLPCKVTITAMSPNFGRLIVDGKEVIGFLKYLLSSYMTRIQSIVDFYEKRRARVDLTHYHEDLECASGLMRAFDSPGVHLDAPEIGPVLQQGQKKRLLAIHKTPGELSGRSEALLKRLVANAQYPGKPEQVIRFAFHTVNEDVLARMYDSDMLAKLRKFMDVVYW